MVNYGSVYFTNILYHTVKFMSIYRCKNSLERACKISGEIAKYTVGANCVRPRETAGLPYE